MIEFYYNCSINKASKHSPIEISYGVQPTTLADRLLLLTGAPAPVADHLTKLASVRDIARELLTLSKQRMAGRSSRPTPIFVVCYFAFLSSKGLRIHSQKIKHLRDQRLGPIQVIEKVTLKPYKLKLTLGYRLHLVFDCDLFFKASSSSPLRHQLAEIESDHNEYAINYKSEAKVDNWPSRRDSYLQILTHVV